MGLHKWVNISGDDDDSVECCISSVFATGVSGYVGQRVFMHSDVMNAHCCSAERSYTSAVKCHHVIIFSET